MSQLHVSVTCLLSVNITWFVPATYLSCAGTIKRGESFPIIIIDFNFAQNLFETKFLHYKSSIFSVSIFETGVSSLSLIPGLGRLLPY